MNERIKEIEKMYSQAADWQVDDLDFFLDFLEFGYKLSDLEYNPAQYLHAKRFMLDHGLLDEDLDTSWKKAEYIEHMRVREITAGVYEIVAAEQVFNGTGDYYTIYAPKTIDIMEYLTEEGHYGQKIREAFNGDLDSQSIDERNRNIAESLYLKMARESFNAFSDIFQGNISDSEKLLDIYSKGNIDYYKAKQILLFQNRIDTEINVFLEDNQRFEAKCIKSIEMCLIIAKLDTILISKDSKDIHYKLKVERNMKNPLSGEFYLAMYRLKNDGTPHTTPIKRYRINGKNIISVLNDIKNEYIPLPEPESMINTEKEA